MKKGDLILSAVVLTVAVGMWIAFVFFGQSGGQAILTTPTETRTLSLATAGEFTVTGHDGIVVTVVVEDGAVRFSHSDCPDQLCVNSGALKTEGAAAACVPAGVTLRVIGEGEVDAVAN